MLEEFLKNDGVFSASDKEPDNSKFHITNPATTTATNTATTANTAGSATTATTATTATDVQMDDISTPTIERTSTGTKSFYSPHVWKQIRLNLENGFHCVEKTNHLTKNQSDLQRIMHKLNTLKNNQPIKKQSAKSINPNQKILAKMVKKKWNEIQNK